MAIVRGLGLFPKLWLLHLFPGNLSSVLVWDGNSKGPGAIPKTVAAPSGSLSDILTDLTKLVLYCLFFFFYNKS